MLNEVGMME